METTKKSQKVFSYRIDDVACRFAHLCDAKKHFFFYSPQEIVKDFYPKTYICGYSLKGDLISITDVIVDEKGNIRFSRTSKLCATAL